MSSNSLINKVVVITGGISGIGYACAVRFAEEGASLVLADLVFQEQPGKGVEVARQLQSEYGVEVIFVDTDVTQENDVEALGAAVLDRFGRVDAVIAAAGIASGSKLCGCHARRGC